MKVLAIYIFRIEGLPLLSRFYDERAQKIDGLVAPFLVSTSNRMEELTGSNIQEIALEDNMHLIMENFADIICAIVVSENQDAKLKLNLVARRFYKRFHKSLSGRGWSGKLDNFQTFVPEMEKLLDIESNVVITSMPSNILDSFIMSDYSKQEQKVLRKLIKSGEINHNEFITTIGEEEPALNLIKKLMEEKLVGVKVRKSGEKLYFRVV